MNDILQSKKTINGCKKLAKTLLFLLLAAVIFAWANEIAQPIWTDWANYDRTEGFYEVPENTIETVFLGTSVMVNGIIPAELYENYGISAYNLGSEQQPMLATYYWLEEAYRLHSESMTTVVLEPSAIRLEVKNAFYRKALDGMQFSTIKMHAVKDHANDFSEMISMLIPVFSYHDRWKSLTETDFQKSSYEPDVSIRGYNLVSTQYVDKVASYSKMAIPDYEGADESVGEADPADESLEYLIKIIEFCEEHELRLVLVKTAIIAQWSSGWHNLVQSIADTYGLEFMDFNFDPYLEESGFNIATDTTDSTHMNYFGASKFTAYIGEYLSEECGNADHRGDEAYAFMDEELEDYQNVLAEYMESNEVTNVEETLTESLEAGAAYEDLTDSEQRLYQYNLACEEKKQSLIEDEGN